MPIEWSRLNRKKKPLVDGRMVPDRNDEYLLYQTLLGVWPSNRMTVLSTAFSNEGYGTTC